MTTTAAPRRATRLLLAAGLLGMSLVASACGSTVAMRTTTSDGLTPQQSLDGTSGVGAALTTGGATSPTGTGSAPAVGGSAGAAGSTGAQSTTGTGGTGPVPGSLPSGPAPQGPLKFGLLDVSSPAAAVGALGAQAQTSVYEQRLAHAFIDYFNAHGGIAGRKLQPVEYTQNPSSTNYNVDMEAACAKFTQDNHVNVVLRAQLGGLTPENYESCLTKARVTSLEFSYAVGDNAILSRHPQLYNVSAPSVDRRERAVLIGLTRSGYLSSKNTIGLIVEDCPENIRAYTNTVAPQARSLGLKIQERTVGCLKGDGDLGAFSAQVQAAVLPFRSAGVDRVTFLSAWEPLMVLFFETNAANQGWHPTYALSSNAEMGATHGQYTNEQLSRMRGIGWSPNTDTGTPITNATTKKCDAMAKSQGIVAQTQGDTALIRYVCDLFLVYKAAVEAAGGHDEPTALSAGLGTASRTFVSATVLGGGLQLGRGHQDAPAQVAEFGFVSSCSCFKYIGPPRPLA